MRKFIGKSADAMMTISCVSLLICVCVNGYEIFMRYFFGKSLYWIQDFTLLLMMWFIFPGIVKVVYSNGDIVVDFFVSKLPGKVRRIVKIITDAVVAVFSALLFYYSLNLLILRQGQVKITSEIPLVYYTLSINLCCILLVFIYMEKLMDQIKKERV